MLHRDDHDMGGEQPRDPAKEKARATNGPLTPEEAATGAKLAMRNAQATLEDALALFRAGRFQRATALALLAAEEAFKPALLAMIAASQPADLALRWRKFRQHREKSAVTAAMHTMRTLHDHALTITKDNEARRAVIDALTDANSEFRIELDNAKNLALYVERVEDRWHDPMTAVGEQDAALAIARAAEVVQPENFWCDPSAVRLLVEHGRDGIDGVAAMIQKARELRLRGLPPRQPPEAPASASS